MLNRELATALKAAGVVWVALDGVPPRVVWHLWHDGFVWTVVGGAEQQLPGAPAGGDAAVPAEVVVRGPQRQGLPAFAVEVSAVEPGSALWDEVVPHLHATRLNAVDGEDQPDRWARASTVLRLQPLPTA